jgi:hypothetical protein
VPPTVRTLAAVLAALALLAPAGCGLSDYEAKMLQADARAQYFDDDNRLLEDPLTAPSTLKGADGHDVYLPTVYFRAPKGISKTADKTMASDFAYRYPRTGKGGGLCYEAYLAFGSAKDPDKLKEQIETWLHAGKQTWEAHEYTPPDRKVTFDETVFNDPQQPQVTIYRAAVHRASGVAVVFRVERTVNWDEAQTAMSRSLASFATGPEAQALRKRAGH